MKILVTGDRNWNDLDTIADVLSMFPPGTILIHGDCRGVDKMCGAVGEALGFIIKSFPADWKKFNRAAGPIRNRQMVHQEHHPNNEIDICVAFHNDFSASKGTKDMVNVAIHAKIPTYVIKTGESLEIHSPIKAPC